jgi:hypothetical protein
MCAGCVQSVADTSCKLPLLQATSCKLPQTQSEDQNALGMALEKCAKTITHSMQTVPLSQHKHDTLNYYLLEHPYAHSPSSVKNFS